MAETNKASDHSLLWGRTIDFWDRLGISALVFGSVLGVAALLLTAASAYVLYRVADVAQKDLESDSKTSTERIATLNNDTARLQADNLALQTVLLPRHVGSIGINEPPKAAAWFAGMERFTNTEFIIQPTAGDSEARNLANEIKVVLYLFGLKATVDENRTTSSQLPDGISVSYPTGRTWTPDVPNQPWFEWHDAAEALANALTSAGLGVGDRPVSRYGFTPRSSTEGLHFNPVTQGVLVLVGSRPVAETVEWIKEGRPDALGNKPGDAAPK